MPNRSKPLFYSALLLSCFLLCVWIALAWHGFWRGFFGDIVVMGAVYGALGLVWRSSILWRSLAVLLFAISIECLQYTKLIDYLGLSDYKIARIVFGTAFDWLDILAYGIGTLVCMSLEKILFPKN